MADDDDPKAGELTTANYGWTKPTVGASDDQWGGYLNTDLDGIDSIVHGIDTRVIPGPSSTTPAMDGTATIGTSTTYARADHIHPRDTTIPAPYVLPTASTSVLGGVKVDGTTVVISGGGVISAASTAPPVVAPPAAASWTHRNWGANTAVADVANGVRLFDSSSAGVSNTITGLSIASPATPYTIDARFGVITLVSANGYTSVAIGWTDGVKAQVLTPLALGSATPATTPYVSLATYATFTTSPGSLVTLYWYQSLDDLWARIADNGTTISFSLSADGISFLPVYSVAKASGYLGSSGYSNVMFGMASTALNIGGSEYLTLKSWYVH